MQPIKKWDEMELGERVELLKAASACLGDFCRQLSNGFAKLAHEFDTHFGPPIAPADRSEWEAFVAQHAAADTPEIKGK